MATDNCTASNALLRTQTPLSGTLIGTGTIAVTITVTDAAGNMTTCTTSFTVQDNTPPMIVACAPARNANSDATGHAAVPDFTGSVQATDNCTASNALVKTQAPFAGTLVGMGATPVTITVRDATGNTATCGTSFQVGAIPVWANFSANTTTGSVPLAVAFSNLSTGTIANVAWNFGDGGTSTAMNPSHTYTNPATFSVSLTVSGPGGTNTLTKPGYISVQPALPPVITGGPTVTNALVQLGNLAVVVAGETNTFYVTAMDPGGNPLSYQWQFGDGITNALAPLGTASHAYLTNCGAYAASVIVSNGYAAVSSNLTAAVACALNTGKPPGKLTATVTYDPKKPTADSASLTATLDLGAAYLPYTPTGLKLTVVIGGAQVPFTLDKNGRGVNGASTCRLTYTKPTKTKPGFWTLTVTLSKGTWRNQWINYGLDNATYKSPGKTVTLPVVVLIGNEAFAAEPQLHYTATLNKTGTAK